MRQESVGFGTRRFGALVIILALGSVTARSQDYELFDRFSVALEGSWVAVDSTIRVDSKTLGIGTELNLESDLNLDRGLTLPTLSVEWRPWQRHRFGLFWKSIDRDSTAQALREIQIGDEVIPVGADVRLGYDIEEYGLAYTYIWRPRERSSFGIGGGLRVLELSTTLYARLEGEGTTIEGEWTTDASVTGPLPFIGGEFRHMFSPKLRFQAELGVFYVEIEDVKGTQALLRASLEHLTFANVGFGLGVGGSTVRLDTEADSWTGEANLDILDVRVFLRVRL